MRITKIFSSLLFLILATACSLMGPNEIIGTKDVAKFSVSTEYNNKDIFLTVNGLAFYSSLVVKNIGSIIHGEKLQIHVFLTPAGSNSQGLSGSFNYTIKIPPEVNIIEFGKSRQIIWQR